MIDLATSDLSVLEAHQHHTRGAMLLDVREPHEFAAEHAPDAVNIPLGQLATRRADMAQEQEVLTEHDDRRIDVKPIRTAGLGDTTYILSHNGVGIVVDPQRDVDRFLDAGNAAGIRIRYVLETHVHNDYVSGGRELARRAQAELVLPAGAGVAFDHTPAFHLEDLTHDGLVVRPIHTPGHTPEHVSYLVFVDGEPAALFSGGSLLVGSAGRPDLLGVERAHQLALAQFNSVQRLARLPEELELFPTHGEGSFCSASSAGRRTSTIGLEKRTNPLLQHQTPDDFASAQLAGLQPYPKYYAFMGPINTFGPEPLPMQATADLSPEQLRAQLDDVLVVDARPRAAFASAHIPGATGVELADDFGTWVGWLAPFNAPIALVLDSDQDLAEAVIQLQRIGFDRVQGVLWGMQRWQDAGYTTESYTLVSADAFAAAVNDGTAHQILDVRSPSEWRSGSVPGAHWRYVPDLVDAAPSALDRSQPVWVLCASGFRASIAASLLQRHGYQPVVLANGGVADVLGQLPV